MAFGNNEFEKYKAEVQEKSGKTEDYKEYTKKTGQYSNDKWNDLVTGMDDIMEPLCLFLKRSKFIVENKK